MGEDEDLKARLAVAVARITELEAEVERKEGMNEQLRVMNRALERSDSEARAQIAAALAVHVPMKYWAGESHDAMYDENGEEVEPEGQVCLTCSGPSTEDDISNWELDLSNADVVEWPCPTVAALSTPVTHPEPEPTPQKHAGVAEVIELARRTQQWPQAARPVVVPEFVAPECPNCRHAQKWHRTGVGCVIEDCPCGLAPTNDLGGPRSAAEYEADQNR